MPRAVPVPLRLRVFELADSGQQPARIAQALDLGPRTVRRLLQRRALLGPDALAPGYRRCGRKPSVCAEALDLRREHPTWGAAYVRTVLEEGRPQPPSARSLQRHFRAAGLQPAGPGRRPGRPRRRASAPHEIWQMDAGERIPLSSGEEVCWLRVVDEYTGAFLRTRVFPPGELGTGPLAADASLPA
jgi:hypothetical protein